MIVILLAAGAVVGLVSGLVGIGGGVLLIPILLFVLPVGFVPEESRLPFVFGTTIVVGWLSALVSSAIHRRIAGGLGTEGVVLGVAAAAGALGGAAAAATLPSEVLRVILAVLLLVAAPLLAAAPEPVGRGGAGSDTSGGRSSHFDSSDSSPSADSAGRPSGPDRDITSRPKGKLILALLGLVIGFLSATAGLGGAVFATPALILLLGQPSRRAIALSTTMMAFTAASATVGYVLYGLGTPGLPPGSLGYVNLFIAGALAATALPLARLGAGLTHRVNVRVLRIVLAVLVAAAAFRLLAD